MYKIMSKFYGQLAYKKAMTIQNSLVNSTKQNGEFHLMLLEHPDTISMGVRSETSEILTDLEKISKLKISIQNSDRGGQTTFHNPGQLVAYPIIDLNKINMKPKDYVAKLQLSIIKTLTHIGINVEAKEMPIGVWVNTKKVASIGVRVKQGITSHGISLNVNNDLKKFEHIISCGIKDSVPTSIQNETNQLYSIHEVATLFSENFASVLELKQVNVKS